jgi:hypothetical protein
MFILKFGTGCIDKRGVRFSLLNSIEDSNRNKTIKKEALEMCYNFE